MPAEHITGLPGRGAIAASADPLPGVALWRDQATADVDGRVTAYFRPENPNGVQAWLTVR